MNARKLPGFIRLVLAGTIIVAAAYWTGARYGQHEPTNVEAVRPNAATPAERNTEPSSASSPATAKPATADLAQRDAILTDDEGINVKVYRAASPAVANILTKATEYDFFMDPVPVEGAGSGFVIDERGYILTNFHVVQEAQSIEVVLGDQTRYPGKFIGADQRNDVALVKIDPKGKHITALPLGDSSKLQVGQKVLAIGNPFGFQSTLTTGVVSALGRTVQTSQTTLIDEAIQINTAKRIATDLINEGRVHLAFIGVQTIPVGGSLAQALELPVEEGLLVENAAKGGPAASAGVRGGDRVVMAGMQRIAIGGDVIVAIDGNKVANTMDLSVILNRKRPGDSVTVTVYRAGKKIDKI